MSLHERGFGLVRRPEGWINPVEIIEPHPFSWDDPHGFIDARTRN
jgi:hypothetical protein